MLPQLRAMGQMACVEGLRRSNDRSAQYRLTLTEPQIQALARRRQEALAEAGRVEFGEGALPQLIAAFCDSPYLCQANYEETLAELLVLFYHFKNESRDRLSDGEVIAGMKRIFDGPAQGAVELLADAPPEALTDPDWGEVNRWSGD